MKQVSSIEKKIKWKKYFEITDKEIWKQISKDECLTEDFIKTFFNKVHWPYILRYQNLSIEFLKELIDNKKFQCDYEDFWTYICWQKCLIENKFFLYKYRDKINWPLFSRVQILSEDFMREFKKYISWNVVSCNQKLSEHFIEEFKDKIDWYSVAFQEGLSENFIWKFKDKLNLYLIAKAHTGDYSDEFMKKLIEYDQKKENFLRKMMDDK